MSKKKKGKSEKRTTEDVLNFLEPMLKNLLEKGLYDKYLGKGKMENFKEFAQKHSAILQGILGILSVAIQRYDPKNPFLSTISELAEDGISEVGRRILNSKEKEGRGGNIIEADGLIKILGDQKIRGQLRNLIRWFVKLTDEERKIVRGAMLKMNSAELEGFVSLTSMLRLEFCRSLIEKIEDNKKSNTDKEKFGFADFINKRTEKIRAISTKLAQRR